MSTDCLSTGQLVVSKKGRDKGKLFVVVCIVDDQFVLIADGKYHKVKKPKRKNVKHLIVLQQVDRSIVERFKANLALTDEHIVSALKSYVPGE